MIDKFTNNISAITTNSISGTTAIFGTITTIITTRLGCY